jgi:hypothetical protein
VTYNDAPIGILKDAEDATRFACDIARKQPQVGRVTLNKSDKRDEDDFRTHAGLGPRQEHSAASRSWVRSRRTIDQCDCIRLPNYRHVSSGSVRGSVPGAYVLEGDQSVVSPEGGCYLASLLTSASVPRACDCGGTPSFMRNMCLSLAFLEREAPEDGRWRTTS